MKEPDDLLGAVHDALYESMVKHGVDELAAIAETQERIQQLQRHYGGREHYWPALGKDRRQRDILQDLQAGVPPATVAQKHGVHPKTVARLDARRRAPARDDPGLGTDDWVLK